MTLLPVHPAYNESPPGPFAVRCGGGRLRT